MIPRYTFPEMHAIWEPESKYSAWLEVEIAVCEGWATLGIVPEEDVRKISANAKFDMARMAEIEKVTRHDLMAFVGSVQESLGPEGRWVHYGVTSYDIEDTALCLLLRRSADIIISDIQDLIEVIKKRAKEFKDTYQIGRTHGIHAEPITFGFKLCVWLAEMQRNLERMKQARENICYGKISGPVGVYGAGDPRVEEYVCKKLGLKVEPVSTQIIQRDHHAQFMTTLAIVSCSIEQFATEVRNLQRTETREVEEFFGSGQRGSSAMPHKRNPWVDEQMCGIARVVRANIIPALENIATWHERDLSMSSVERIVLPDNCQLVDYQLRTFKRILENLLVYPENMQKNLEKMGKLTFSEHIMLALVQAGLSRDEAYKVVQSNAMEAWGGKDFEELIREDPRVSERLTKEQLDHCFDIKYHLRNLEVVFKRLGI